MREQDQSLYSKGRSIIALLLVGFTVLLIVSFYNSNGVNESTNTRNGDQQREIMGGQAGQTVGLQDVANDSQAFIGKTVTVRGEVDQNLGTRGLTVESPGLADDEVLVVSRDVLIGVGGGPGESLYQQDENVQVSGTVREFRIAEIEKDLGVDLDDSRFQQYEGKPVIVADSINTIEEM